MKKDSLHSEQEENLSIESRLKEWIQDKGRLIIYTLAAFFIGALTLHFTFRTVEVSQDRVFQGSIKQLQSYAQGDQDFDLEVLESIFSDHPTFRSRYEGKIVQSLIKSSSNQEALEQLLKNILVRLDGTSIGSFYKDFVYTTLLIQQKDYDEALKRALKLHGELRVVEDISSGDQFLYAYNQLRVISLARTLKLQDLEDEHRKEWIQHAQLAEDFSLTEETPESYKILFTCFEEGSISLKDFLSVTDS